MELASDRRQRESRSRKRARAPGSNPGPGENFSLKLTTYSYGPDGYSENQIFISNDKIINEKEYVQ